MRYWQSSLLRFEEIIECLAHIIALNALCAAARGEWNAGIRFEEIAEVRPPFIAHIFCLRFAALIVLAGIEESAVFAAMHICAAMRAFVGPDNFADQFYLSSTIMTDHNSPFVFAILH